MFGGGGLGLTDVSDGAESLQLSAPPPLGHNFANLGQIFRPCIYFWRDRGWSTHNLVWSFRGNRAHPKMGRSCPLSKAGLRMAVGFTPTEV